MKSPVHFFGSVIHSSLTSHLLEWQTMQLRVEQWGGSSEGLISTAQVHPSSRIASYGREVGGGGARLETRERGLKWFVTWFCSLLWLFFLLTSSRPGGSASTVIKSRRRHIRFSPPFVFVLEGVWDQDCQRKNQGGLSALLTHLVHPTPCLGVNCVMFGCISCNTMTQRMHS